MQIRHLAYLIELERAGSINKAAANLYISQQGLSKILDSVEAELGVTLVERSRSGARFTAAGRTFLGHARGIVDAYRKALDDLSPSVEGSSEQLEVVVSTYIVMVLMGEVLPRLSDASKVNHTEMGNLEIAEMILANDDEHLFLFDWVGTDPLGGKGSLGGDFEVGRLTSVRMGIATRGTERARSVTRKEVLGRPIVAYGRSDYRHMLKQVLAVERIPPLATSLSSKELLTKTLSQLNRSCAVIDELSYRGSVADDEGLTFLPFSPVQTLTVGYAFNRRGVRAAQFRAYLQEWQKALEASNGQA